MNQDHAKVPSSLKANDLTPGKTAPTGTRLGKFLRRRASEDSIVSTTSDAGTIRSVTERGGFPALKTVDESKQSLPYIDEERESYSTVEVARKPRRPSESTTNSLPGEESPVAGREHVRGRSTDIGLESPSQPSTPRRMFERLASPSPSRTGSPIPSGSKLHWNQVRNAIKPGGVLSHHEPWSPTTPTSAVSSTQSIPPRSQTPKPSKFARLGFRQVVEQTRAAVLNEEPDRFQMDVYQACLRARFGSPRPKVEKETFQPGYLPFMSTASLTATAALNQGRAGSGAEYLPPSLSELHQVLVRYASGGSAVGAWRLPYEAEVLSVLLIPFLLESRRDSNEQWLAVEAFELAVQTWAATNKQREVDRLLWCCKASLMPACPVRSRILGTLSNMLFSSKPVQDANPLALQNLFQGLQMLVHTITQSPSEADGDIDVTRELCSHLYQGGCGDPLVKSIEQEYDAEWSSYDAQDALRVQILAEAAVRCMQCGSDELRRWALHNQVATYWPATIGPSTALSRAVATRRLNAFLQSALSLLRLEIARDNRRSLHGDVSVIFQLVMSKVLAELQQLPATVLVADCRYLVVHVLVELLRIDDKSLKYRIIDLFCHWYDTETEWKASLEAGVRLLVEKAEWLIVARNVGNLFVNIPGDYRTKMMSVVIPALHSRFVMDPALNPPNELTSLFEQLTEHYPQQFYVPLFALANAAKEPTLIGQLSIVTALARVIPSFWRRDPEMLSIAVMVDPGKGKANNQTGPWGRPRLGQSLIMVEFIRCLRELTKQKKDPTAVPDSSHNDSYKFATGLESRLALLAESKEADKLIPFSQRLLLAVLFFEIRLYTRSLKPASWMSTIVRWASQSYLGATLTRPNDSNPFTDNESLSFVADDAYLEQFTTIQKLRALYAACSDAPISSSRQRSTLAVSAYDIVQSAGLTANSGAINEAVKERQDLLDSLPTSTSAATLRLLVSVCGLLSHLEYQPLVSTLWSIYLEEEDSSIIAPTCFLLTHCLEKSPEDLVPIIKGEIQSQDKDMKIKVINRLMALFAWRTELLGQTYISDRAHRRPFRLARQPIPFVALDVGSSIYVHEQSEEDIKKLSGGALPYDIRKKLAEVGWEQDEGPTDTKQERIRAPISLFSASHLETYHGPRSTVGSPTVEAGRPLLRRKSSGASSAHSSTGNKRRPVFVPALVSLFPLLASLTSDLDPFVANGSREAIMIVLRDDPNMICRPVFEALSSELPNVAEHTSTFRSFLRIHHRLPPSASHHIFSSIGGFLKNLSKDSDDPNALRAFSYSLPILSKLVTQVSNLSVRDLRRSKFEIFVFPTGALWFPVNAPSSAMFPRTLTGPSDSPNEVPELMGLICMIRTAQNMLLLDMLKHKPQEVQTVRKSLMEFVLPADIPGRATNSYIPLFNDEEKGNYAYEQVSLALSRSHLLLLAQVFRSMPRNFSGKQELTRLFDGLNSILLAHGNDLGIVAHALIACLIGATRFRRFVASSGGFSLFMPSLLKVYAEAEKQPAIRQAIQYASSRLYAIHEDAYLFHSLVLASQTLCRIEDPRCRELFTDAIWDLFSSLKAAPRPGSPDPASIHGCNRSEEKEVLIAAAIADDAITSSRSEGPQGDRLKKIMEIGEFPAKVLDLADFAKLFLTIIAHDTTILRAQHFLILFRHLAPKFYNGSKSARDVLRDGTNALAVALFPKSSRTKMTEGDRARSGQAEDPEASAKASNKAGDAATPSDPLIMRREYLKLVVSFVRMGGDLRHGTIKQALELFKGLLKEPTRPDPQSEGAFFQQFMDGWLTRLSINAKQALSLLSDIAPVLRTFALSIDCSGAIDSITQLLKHSELVKVPKLVQFVVEEVAGPLLEACSQAASDNLLLSLPIRSSVVSLLAQLGTLEYADVASIIEIQPASPGFLCGIVLPLCMIIQTSAEISSEHQFQTKYHAAKHGIIFVRLLAYVMNACQASPTGDGGKSSPLPGLNRRGSNTVRKGSNSLDRANLATMAMTIQIIKIIILRASDDISVALVGIWSRLARFLNRLLTDGDAHFALPPYSSPAASPYHSPQLTPINLDPFLQQPTTPGGLGLPSAGPSSMAPRVVDYLTWSLMEYLCCSPSPLNLQMRLWMQEKANTLDAELRAREVPTPSYKRRSRRLSSSVFAKPRGSSVSPDALRPTGGLSRTPSELNLSLSLTPDFNSPEPTPYNRFPSPATPSNPSTPWNGPRIRHLGPTRGLEAHPPLHLESPLKTLARSSNIALPGLIGMTRTRIRIVQTCMGFDRLLPPQQGQRISHSHEALDINLKPWTKTSALSMIAEEARLIIEEFSECFKETVGGGYIEVDIPPATPITPTINIVLGAANALGAIAGMDKHLQPPPTPSPAGRMPVSTF
ncbi:hypothetical protein M422DRAFT_261273 [Sphaerobolus stellatus SS14]|uniref:Protein UNC80 C-terminal domain-containing protein n=1 Tax=Sphaerobolus stellatus (strain SS14) TaxID=990650 RepID=A0A0C9U0Q0_SPHS4|nr:hypothetical protein M422DRAFT_261273 [Sphaerobolus stellatus SS14]